MEAAETNLSADGVQPRSRRNPVKSATALTAVFMSLGMAANAAASIGAAQAGTQIGDSNMQNRGSPANAEVITSRTSLPQSVPTEP
jgi:hypothetical protein